MHLLCRSGSPRVSGCPRCKRQQCAVLRAPPLRQRALPSPSAELRGQTGVFEATRAEEPGETGWFRHLCTGVRLPSLVCGHPRAAESTGPEPAGHWRGFRIVKAMGWFRAAEFHRVRTATRVLTHQVHLLRKYLALRLRSIPAMLKSPGKTFRVARASKNDNALQTASAGPRPATVRPQESRAGSVRTCRSSWTRNRQDRTAGLMAPFWPCPCRIGDHDRVSGTGSPPDRPDARLRSRRSGSAPPSSRPCAQRNSGVPRMQFVGRSSILRSTEFAGCRIHGSRGARGSECRCSNEANHPGRPECPDGRFSPRASRWCWRPASPRLLRRCSMV